MSNVKSFRQLIGVEPSKASTRDSTLIIIDAQNEYASGALKTVNVEGTRKAISTLLEKYRSTSPYDGKNIVHVTHQTPSGAPVFTPDTELAQEFDELKPKKGEHVISKQFPSSFAKTGLHEYLGDVPEEAGKKIVLVGYMAHVCVSTTARAGAELGYDVVIARDGVGDRDIPGLSGADVTDVSLKELEDAFATVINVSDISG